MLFVLGLVALKLAALKLGAFILAHVPLLLAESSTESASAPILVVIVALIGSGGLGYFLDRRSAQASRLAQDAVSATDVFQASLDEERKRRAQMSEDLAAARAELVAMRAQHEQDAVRIAELSAKVTRLSNDLAEARLIVLEHQNERRPQRHTREGR